MTSPPRPAKGSLVDLRIDTLVYGGNGLGRVNGYVLFVPRTAVGDLVRVRVTRSKTQFGEGEVVEILEAAPSRTAAPCAHFGHCGGCSWQHLDAAAQLVAKRGVVADALRQIAGLRDVPVEETVPSPLPFRYRNKVEFTFGRDRTTGRLKLGFHEPGDWREALDVGNCWLAPECMNRALEAARREGERQGLNAWSPVRHEGTLRQLLLRYSFAEDKLLVALLTGDEKGVDFEAFVEALRSAVPEAKGILWGINAGKSDVARAERIIGRWGEETLEEKLGDLGFRVSLGSFFQTNSLGALRLYEVTREFLGLTGREQILDAYCGTGTIGIFCARQARQVYGIELVREAIWDARENAERNGLRNCTFVAGDMRAALPQLMNTVEGRMDAVIVDPPRGGIDRRALEQLLALQAPVLVYVSCNPTTMARDMQQALEAGYMVERVRPVDMFPQTYHVECVVRCVRRAN